MIVSSATGDVSVAVAAQQAHWQSLIRRGMLHSECEGVEYWALPPAGRLPVRADHGVEEAVLVLDGELSLHTPESKSLVATAGRLLLIPHGLDGELVAGDRPATVLTIRGLPAEVSAQLPPRIPELPPVD
ncbi:hypothetical protein AB0E62_38430 [Streptomyces sp. NPDC038707]|uniref:hypothetical protein n=1 Tax=unclassified Streptomyces TaxID=2593676 RepID=UPI0033F8C7FF